jgi:NAD(P)H-hydrate epimerase
LERGYNHTEEIVLHLEVVVLVKIVSVEQMRKIEKAADAAGLTYADMMEKAGRGIANVILERWPHMDGLRVTILVGSGNNGGDGLVVGHYLSQAGAKISVYLTKERSDEDRIFSRLRDRTSALSSISEDPRKSKLKSMLQNSDMVIDAVLGTGVRLPLQGSAKDVLATASKVLGKLKKRPIVIAVDCPSGLDCDTGALAKETIFCDLTVSLAASKTGLHRFPGAEAVGELLVIGIGIPKDQKELASVELELATKETIKSLLPARPKSSHKGTFGRALIIAGSINYPGAAALAGQGAYRVGAGLVTLAVPSPVQPLIAPQLPEATWIILPHEMGVIAESAAQLLPKEFGHTQAILLGPGLGQESATLSFMKRLFGRDTDLLRSQLGFVRDDSGEQKRNELLLPCVVDADGLKLLKQIPDWFKLLPEDSILTPHPGEMSILTDVTKDEIQQDRVGAAKHWAKTWGHIVVLKGAFTVVAAPDGRSAVMPFATPALASAGTGDVLAGAIVGLRAQGVGSFEAAVLGAYLHGRAGELAGEALMSLKLCLPRSQSCSKSRMSQIKFVCVERK